MSLPNTAKTRARRLKRALDVVVSGILLAAALPIMALMWVLIRWQMGAPVLFRQTRPGLRGRPFQIFKFRTMRDASRDGRPLPDEERLTALGRLIRSLSLDELPQLWNVLHGDMSLVGPRPLLMDYLPLYNPVQARRHEVPPGITGWAQVNGRNAVSWEERFRMDVWYVDHWSLALDAKILCMTIRKVLLKDGISQPGKATMEPFTGSATNSSRLPS